MRTVYFVISLPRTGTSSISRMAKMVGFTPQHPPHQSFIHNWKGEWGWNFFSDTPTFCPKNVEMVCQSDEIEPKFIFIERDFDEVFKSWVDVKLFYNYNNTILASKGDDVYLPAMEFDLDSYSNAFDGEILTEDNYKILFENHKSKVLSIVEKYQKPILIYNFNQGWKSFCEFTNTEIPEEEIPHLNNKKIYEKI
jgi:hypothetical protein